MHPKKGVFYSTNLERGEKSGTREEADITRTMAPDPA